MSRKTNESAVVASMVNTIAALPAAPVAAPQPCKPVAMFVATADKPLRPNYFFKVVGDIARGDYTEAKRAVDDTAAKWGFEAAQRLRRTLWKRAQRSSVQPA